MLKIDSFKLSIAIALVALGCLVQIPVDAGEQRSHTWHRTLSRCDHTWQSDRIRQSSRKRMQMYDRAVHELHQGHAVPPRQTQIARFSGIRNLPTLPQLAATAALDAGTIRPRRRGSHPGHPDQCRR